MKRIFLVLAVVACSDVTAPVPIAADWIQHEVTDDYRSWWGELESCSGLTGNIETVRFYSATEADAEGNISVDGKTVAGHADIRGRWIVVNPRYVDSEWLIEHEMMHILLGYEGHPAEYFNGRCGNLM